MASSDSEEISDEPSSSRNNKEKDRKAKKKRAEENIQSQAVNTTGPLSSQGSDTDSQTPVSHSKKGEEEAEEFVHTEGFNTQGSLSCQISNKERTWINSKVTWLLVIFVSCTIAAISFQSDVNLLLFILPLRADDDFQRKDALFMKRIDRMSARYKNQSPELWKELKSIGATHFNPPTMTENLHQPLVVTLVGFDENADKVHSFARDVAEAFSFTPFLELDNTPTQLLGSSTLKLQFERLIEAHLQESNTGVVFTKALNSLSYQDASIFFKFCDHSNTDYPLAVFVFSLTVPRANFRDIKTSNRKAVLQASESFLVNDKWGQVGDDLSYSLSIRVLDTVLYVNSEI